jgi:hypothetical protein
MLAQLWIWLAIAAVVVALAVAGLLLAALRRPKRATVERARKLFHLQRERAEHRFFVLAAASGKPRGLEWTDCEFEDGVSLARDRQSGRLQALVGVTVRFKAVVGGGMEENPNVSLPRAATAVFHLDGDDWTTHGRVIFNLNPAEAIKHHQQELEVVE